MGLLGNIFGGGRQSGMSPITVGLLGLLAYRTFQGKGRLAGLLGRDEASAGQPARGNTGQPEGGDWLRNILGGTAAGGILSGGLGDLLKSFQQGGKADAADSWVAKGPNKDVSPGELQRVLGPEKISWLMEETGLSQEELLAGLTRELPDAVDKLTPAGRLPTQEEAEKMV